MTSVTAHPGRLRGSENALDVDLFGRARDWYTYVGAALIAYAMVVNPLIGMFLGHGHPRAPMFGVAPCSTTIFTFGILLLSARPRRLLPPPFSAVRLQPFCNPNACT